MRFSATDRLMDRGREAGLYLWNAIRPNPPSQLRVVIFGQGRTGSTLLESLLCSTGHFEGFGELLNIDRYAEILRPLDFVQGLAKWKSDNNFLFHVKVYQLTRDRRHPVDPALFLKSLCARGWRVLHLRRDNVVKHVFSNIMAEHRGAYHKVDDRRVDEEKVTVHCQDFVTRVQERLRFAEEEKAILSTIDHHVVVYDRDLESTASHQRTVDRVLEYLSLERRDATSKQRKITTKALADLISNYQEFAECMTTHGWQGFLDG